MKKNPGDFHFALFVSDVARHRQDHGQSGGGARVQWKLRPGPCCGGKHPVILDRGSTKIGAGFFMTIHNNSQRTSHDFEMMTHNQCKLRNGHSDSSIKIWNFLKQKKPGIFSQRHGDFIRMHPEDRHVPLQGTISCVEKPHPMVSSRS